MVRSGARGLVAAATAVAAIIAFVPAAQADHHRTVPTQAQVDAAKATAEKKAADVATLKAQLAVANQNLQSAATKAELAAEAYNGALWRLDQAKKATDQAKAAALASQAEVDARRSGIAQLVTQSYQDGTALDRLTAYLGGDGPQAIMDRWGVVQSAGESMKAQYDEYTALSALAQVATAKAEQAQQAQAALTQNAAKLRDAAAAAANVAQSEAAQIAHQRSQLIADLAKAQKISIALATRRQQALEQIAQQKAAAAAEAAAKHAAEQAKHQTQQQVDQAAQTQDEIAGLGPEGGWNDPGLPVPAGTSVGAAKAIKFARAQLGKPYQWGGAGPDTWDCSGLTMMAWREGGVSLPHFAAAQYQLTKHLSIGDLKPGDLVFWGTSPNTIHHVALYIGSGQIIQAPHTGAYVEVSPLYAWPPDFFGRP